MFCWFWKDTLKQWENRKTKCQILTAMRTNNTESPIEFLKCSRVVGLIHLLRVLKPSLVSLLSFPKNWWQWRQTIEATAYAVVPTCGRSCGRPDTGKNLKHLTEYPFMNHHEITQTFRPWQCRPGPPGQLMTLTGSEQHMLLMPKLTARGRNITVSLRPA